MGAGEFQVTISNSGAEGEFEPIGGIIKKHCFFWGKVCKIPEDGVFSRMEL
jgi:hypothetical protein